MRFCLETFNFPSKPFSLQTPRCIHPLALCPPVLEPELYVLLLQPRELLPVGQPVELLRVPGDERVRRVRVAQEPLLQAGHLGHRVDEGPVALALLGVQAAEEAGAAAAGVGHGEGRGGGSSSQGC